MKRTEQKRPTQVHSVSQICGICLIHFTVNIMNYLHALHCIKFWHVLQCFVYYEVVYWLIKNIKKIIALWIQLYILIWMVACFIGCATLVKICGCVCAKWLFTQRPVTPCFCDTSSPAEGRGSKHRLGSGRWKQMTPSLSRTRPWSKGPGCCSLSCSSHCVCL